MAVDMGRMSGLPAKVYHPVFGEKEVKDANEAFALSQDWFNTPEEADAHRTWTEAEMNRHHNMNVKTQAATSEGAPGVLRNSNQATMNANKGNPEPL